MNKKTIIIISVIGAILLIGLIIFLVISEDDELYGPHADALRFKEEYERLNGEVYENDSELVFQTINIPENNPFRFVELEEIINLLENGGTGVVYLGWSSCSWCRNLVPILADTAIESGVPKIFHRDISEDRNILELYNNEIIEVRAGHPDYIRLLELLGELVPVYREIFPINDGSFRRIYVPVVLFIRDGEIIRYQGNLDSFQNRINQSDDLTSFDEMNEDEIDELQHLFLEYFARLFDN